MPRVRTSRRIAALKDTDCDHEIDLVDRSFEDDEDRPLSRTDTDANLLSSREPSRVNSPGSTQQEGEISESQGPEGEGEGDQGVPSIELPREENGTIQAEPSAQGDMPAPEASRNTSTSRSPPRRVGSRNGRLRATSQTAQGANVKSRPRPERENTIDILYENERGGFCCGIPLFSSAALGNLDPPAWTNRHHKPSPTNIRTAQVPDPSWRWVWPEWRVNHDSDSSVAMDKNGWEYSFMFSKKFSWHGPKWWNSFVRRRAWIRRRVKVGADEGFLNDPHLLNAEYFTVGMEGPHGGKNRMSGHSRSVSKASSTRGGSTKVSGVGGDRISMSQMSRLSQGFEAELEEAKKNLIVEDVDSLMFLLRRSRIDREKIEMVENYLEHGDRDLVRLQEFMHEIMSIFVFQASRRVLLARLTQIHDETIAQAKKGKSSVGTEKDVDVEEKKEDGKESKKEGSPTKLESTPEFGPSEAQTNADIQAKVDWLAAAVHHADEEVRKLEYWSDVKSMAEAGETHAVDKSKGWSEGWEGIDRSGAKGVKGDSLP